MDRIIYTAMNGAKQIMFKQASNNHNLANLNTTGFRQDIDAFKSHPMYGPGHPTRVYTEDTRAGVDFSSGTLVTTGNNLDIAVNGDGFIAIQDVDGNESLTRRGDLRVSPDGLLETGDGYPVMGNGGPIAVPPFENMEIATDGTITIQPLGQSAATLAVIDRIKLVNPPHSDLEKTESGKLRLKDELEAEPDGTITISQGTLEGSNVNAMEALVNMIELSRQFEMHVKVLKDAEETDKAAQTIARVGG